MADHDEVAEKPTTADAWGTCGRSTCFSGSGAEGQGRCDVGAHARHQQSNHPSTRRRACNPRTSPSLLRAPLRTARRLSWLRSSANVSFIAVTSSSFNALWTSGRFNVRVAYAPSFSTNSTGADELDRRRATWARPRVRLLRMSIVVVEL